MAKQSTIALTVKRCVADLIKLATDVAFDGTKPPKEAEDRKKTYEVYKNNITKKLIALAEAPMQPARTNAETLKAIQQLVKDVAVPEVAGEASKQRMKTAEQILDEIQALAIYIAKIDGWDIKAEGYLFQHEHSRAGFWWAAAVHCYESLTATEVADAISEWEETNGK